MYWRPVCVLQELSDLVIEAMRDAHAKSVEVRGLHLLHSHCHGNAVNLWVSIITFK
jgi:hypothetical protein